MPGKDCHMPKYFGVGMFLTSQLYFGSMEGIRKHSREFDCIAQQDDVLIRNWNRVIGADDVVIVLGGFSDNPEKKTIMQRIGALNGHKGIILSEEDKNIGNIDWWLKAGFAAVMNKSIFLDNCGIVLSVKPIFNCAIHNFFGENLDWTGVPNHACVATDKWDFTPVRLTHVLKSVGPAKNKEERIEKVKLN